MGTKTRGLTPMALKNDPTTWREKGPCLLGGLSAVLSHLHTIYWVLEREMESEGDGAQQRQEEGFRGGLQR